MKTVSKRFEASSIKNKIKREDVARKAKKEKRQLKLQKRLAQAKLEASDPAVKKKRLTENVPRTLDNTREFDPSILTANPVSSEQQQSTSDPSSSTSTIPNENQQPTDETLIDISTDPFASYFNSAALSDPSIPPKVLITTSSKATKVTYEFAEELVDIIPGAELIRRKKGKGFEMGNIAAYAANRGYTNLIVINEDTKRLNALTIVHLPSGPSAYFRLSSVQLTKQISGHARSTNHFPELILNNFVTRLGHTIGRMFQTLFPPMPEFQGRQVVTLHNQRDFLFFRRHRYAFRSPEKAALQEIGPRFTLKLRWVKKDIPAVQDFGQVAKPLEFAHDLEMDPEEPNTKPNENDEPDVEDATGDTNDSEATRIESEGPKKKIVPPTQDEYLWKWAPKLETTRRTFFL